jgi:hypothetical protein
MIGEGKVFNCTATQVDEFLGPTATVHCSKWFLKTYMDIPGK